MTARKIVRRNDSTQRSAEPLPGLTGVRGIAAVGVFLYHLQPAALSLFGLDPGQGLSVVASGFRDVDLFFILSGFVLFHVHSGAFVRLDVGRITTFYTQRFFRVYPLNTFVLLLLVPLPFVLPQFVEWHRLTYAPYGAYNLRNYSVGGFVQSLLLAQTWTFVQLGTWNGPAWSLSAEVLGYAVFPFLAAYICRRTSGFRAGMLAIASLTILVLLLAIGGHARNNPNGVFAVIRMAFCFAAGVCLCRSFQLLEVSRVSAAILTLVSVAVIGACFWQDRLGLFSVFGFAGLIFGLAYRSGPVDRLLTTGPMMFLGRISFSLYLVHLPPLDLFDWLARQGINDSSVGAKSAALIGMIAACFVLATLTYHLVEVPFQRVGRHVSAGMAASLQARHAV
jgi:peptidoglycan/LPS O-acetylase OafA/YrhL